MCDPVTALVVGSTLLSAKGAIDQGNYQAGVASNNAKLQQYAAADATARGAIEEQQQRTRTRQLMGAQRAALAANGVDASTGTASNLLQDSAASGEFDALTIRANAAKAAWGYNTQAAAFKAEARNARSAGKNAAFTTLLTGGAQAYGYKKTGGTFGSGSF